MSKRIQTYQDLLDERRRLEGLLVMHKEAMRQDVELIKQDLAPLRHAASFVGKFFTKKDNSFVVDAGISTLITFGVKRLLLARAGWFTRLVVPYFLKNFSSHVVAKNKNAIMKKLFSLIGKKHSNGHPKYHDQDSSTPG